MSFQSQGQCRSGPYALRQGRPGPLLSELHERLRPIPASLLQCDPPSPFAAWSFLLLLLRFVLKPDSLRLALGVRCWALLPLYAQDSLDFGSRDENLCSSSRIVDFSALYPCSPRMLTDAACNLCFD